MLYEDQADRYDERAGLSAEAAEAVARALAEITAPAPGQTLLEVGAGTGALGLALLRLPARYVGFDRSPAMVATFRETLDRSGAAADVRVADGNERWPVPDRTVAVVCCARALHHLDAGHVVGEVGRVLEGPQGWLVLGRVRRPEASLRARLRREMRRLLQDAGYAGRSHDRQAEAVFAAIERAGGRRLPPRTVARWTTLQCPADALADWEGKRGLAGLDVPEPVKHRVLDALRTWARGQYGDLDRLLEQEEFFELAAIQVRID